MEKQQLPNASAVLVLGILSILLGCLLLGLILGIIGLVISKEPRQLYAENPDKYFGYGSMNAGRIMCIIGIVIGGLAMLKVIFALAVGGAILGSMAGFLS